LSPSTYGIKHALRQPVPSAEFQGGPRQRPPPAWRPIGLHGPDSFRERHSAPGVLETARARALAPPPALGPPLAPCARTAAPSPASAHLNSTGTLHRPSGSDGAPPGPPAPGAARPRFPRGIHQFAPAAYAAGCWTTLDPGHRYYSYATRRPRKLLQQLRRAADHFSTFPLQVFLEGVPSGETRRA
jgi:hypothetical protein